jgi:SAM-dependent methyltransferase
MEYTGERLVPGKRGLELLELEHRGRYDLAGSICAGKNVLDVGCGTGYGTALLAQYARSVVGIDAAVEAIEFAKENFLRDNLRFEVLDITSSEAENRLHEISRHKFDVVVCFELIEHLSSPVSLLDLVKTVLRPGGRFIVSTPNSARPHRFTERENPYHVVEYEREGLRGLLGGRFKHVHVLSQTVHLATRIQAGNYRERMDSWPRDQLPTAKYFVAICSDKRLDSDSKRGLLLLASDQHVTLLQSLLADLRKAQANKAEAIERLQALLDQATEDARSRQSRIENLTQEIEQRATAEQELRSLIEEQERTIHELNQEIDRLDVNTREVKRGVETDRSQSSRAKQDLERQIELQEDQVQQLTRQLEERAATIEELNDLLENDRLKSLRKKEDLERQIQLEEDQVQRLTRQLEERASGDRGSRAEAVHQEREVAGVTGETRSRKAYQPSRQPDQGSDRAGRGSLDSGRGAGESTLHPRIGIFR